jgi:ABC-2 type transport system ATP-binding protein
MQKFLTIREIAGMLQIAYDKFVYDDFIIECEKFKLPLDKAIKSFSTGMLAKLKLLIAMSYDANLLILDEPTSGLDTVARNELLNKIKKYAKSSNKAVLMSSHIGSDLKKICDILYFMKDGKIIYKENTHTLLNEYVLIDMEDISSIDKNDILFELKDDDFYSLIIKKKDAYLPYIRSNFDIDDMIEVVMRGDKGEGINL